MGNTRDQLLTEVMDWQKDYFIKNIKERKPLKGTICTKDYQGGLYITTGPQANSLAKPVYLDIHDLATMKKLCNPDELVATGNYKALCSDFPEWQADGSLRDFSSFSILEKSRLCDAFNQFVYRDSNLVKSYQQPLDHYYFPMKAPVFEIEDMVVTKGHPLYIGQPGEEPTIVHFRNLTLEPGAQLVALGLANVICEQCESQGSEAEPSILASVGNNGTDNTQPGGNGSPGTAGSAGVCGTSGKDTCSVGAQSGHNGTAGSSGNPGKPGGNGTNGSILEKKEKVMKGTFFVYSNGGSGGKGSQGGKGGTGGTGGDAAAASGHCGAGAPGKGGNGGSGGTGGNGGNAGNGGEVNIMYNQELSPTAEFKVLTPAQAAKLGLPEAKGGAAGAGGPAGDAGTGGRTYNTSGSLVPSGDDYKGQAGEKGSGGDVGASGKMGDIFINGMYID